MKICFVAWLIWRIHMAFHQTGMDAQLANPHSK